MSKIMTEDMHANADYPTEFTQIDIEGIMGMAMNNIVWDIQNNTIIDLGENKVVITALKGTRKLSDEEVVEIYGEERIFEHIEYPSKMKQMKEDEGAFWSMLTYFDSVKVPVIAHGIDLMESGVITGKSNLDFANDIYACVLRQYAHYNQENVYKIGQYGQYFPAVCEDPLKYIQYQPELRDSLQELKDRGVRLFLATNSHTESMDLIMETTLGENWKSLFDFQLAYCCKPSFFFNKTPFYSIDEKASNMKGPAIEDASQLEMGNVYLQGNGLMLHQFYQKLLGKDQVRVCYFGDHLGSDVAYGGTFKPDLPGQDESGPV